MKIFFKNWWPAILFALLIYLLSAILPAAPVPHGWDKLVHFLEFALLAFFVARGVFLSANLGRWSGIILAGVIAAAWGVLDEFHQSFVPGREASAWDALADGMGALMGAVIFIYLGVWLYRNEKLYPRKCG